MLTGLLVVIFCGTALGRPGYGPAYGVPHQGPIDSPSRRDPLVQVDVCDTCKQTVAWLQTEINNDKETILEIVELLGQLCSYLPEQYQPNCVKFFEKEIPIAIDEFLDLDPLDLCVLLTLCNDSGQLPTQNTYTVRDRIVKQMMSETRNMERNIMRMTMREDMCDECLDKIRFAREWMLDNSTQQEVVSYIYEICDYLPSYLYGNCTEFADGVPAIMEQIANKFLVDSICEEIGLCDATVDVQPVDAVTDIFDRFGVHVPSIDIPVNPGIQNPQQPGRNPYGPGYGPRPGHRHQPGHGSFGVPQRPMIRPQRPYKPRPNKPTLAPNPSFNLDDILGKNLGGRTPQLPDINVPGLGRINFDFERRRQRSAEKMHGFEKIADKVIEYLPEPFPSVGITIKPEKKPQVPVPAEDCNICKAIVSALKSWLWDNSAELERLVLRFAEPVCAIFPGPLREGCITEVTDFMDTFIHDALRALNKDRACKWIGACIKDKHLPPKEPTEGPSAPEVPTTRLHFP